MTSAPPKLARDAAELPDSPTDFPDELLTIGSHQSLDLVFLDSVLQGLASPALILDAEARVICCNLSCKILLQKSGRILKRKLSTIYPQIDWAQFILKTFTEKCANAFTINIDIKRGLSTIKNRSTWQFMPVNLGGVPYILTLVIPPTDAESPYQTPHDCILKLRDPLTIILGHLELILSEKCLPEDKEHSLKKIHKNAGIMAGLINTLLTTAEAH